MRELSCRQVSELISPHLDGYTTAEEEAALESHFKLCLQCAAEFEGFRKISNSLSQMNGISCPDNLTSDIMCRLREENLAAGKRFISRFGPVGKAVAAVAAAAMIMAGSAGLTVGYRFMANHTGNDPEPPGQQYEIVFNNGETPVETEVPPAAKDPDPAPGSDSTVNNKPAAPVKNDAQPPGDRTGPITPTPGRENGTVTTDGEPAVLLSHDIIVESTILKLAALAADDASSKAVSMAGGAGGSAQVLVSQTRDGALIKIVHIAVPRDKAPDLLEALVGLGTTVLDRQDEKRNNTAQYRDLSARYNELISLRDAGAVEDAGLLESRIKATREQLDNLTRDATNYSIILWLEQKGAA